MDTGNSPVVLLGGGSENHVRAKAKPKQSHRKKNEKQRALYTNYVPRAGVALLISTSARGVFRLMNFKPVHVYKLYVNDACFINKAYVMS